MLVEFLSDGVDRLVEFLAKRDGFFERQFRHHRGFDRIDIDEDAGSERVRSRRDHVLGFPRAKEIAGSDDRRTLPFQLASFAIEGRYGDCFGHLGFL